jgi:hypothetical protein
MAAEFLPTYRARGSKCAQPRVPDLFPCSGREGPCSDVARVTVAVEEAVQGHAPECNKGPAPPRELSMKWGEGQAVHFVRP